MPVRSRSRKPTIKKPGYARKHHVNGAGRRAANAKHYRQPGELEKYGIPRGAKAQRRYRNASMAKTRKEGGDKGLRIGQKYRRGMNQLSRDSRKSRRNKPSCW